jgi:circadian clock protein KaiC
MERLRTGISGLDDVLVGGLPAGQMYLVEGDPGAGKTTIAMQFALAGAEAGGTSLYVTLSETRNELVAAAESHDLNLDRVVLVEFVPDEIALSPETQYTVFHPSEVELAGTIQRLIQHIDKHQPDRLVIDSLSELRLLASDSMRYRRQLLALKQYLSGRRTTALLLDDHTASGSDLQLRSIAHGVISLENLPRSFGVTRRRLEVAKLRGSQYREGFHDYTIKHGGVVVYPRLIAAEHNEGFAQDQVSSGIRALDDLFGGGLNRGSSVLITGPTGVGKSSISMQYATTAAKRGDRTIIYCFDEILSSAIRRGESLGMPVREQIASGNLRMTQVDPAELSPGEFIWQIRDDVANHDTRFVIIDSLNGLLYAMAGEQDMILHLHELLAYLNQRGVITILILTQHGLVGSMDATLDVSYLADTVLLLRYFEDRGAIHQAISVVKKRGGSHERSIREFSFGKNGVHVGEPLENFRGVLTGVPEFIAGRAAKASQGISSD